VTSIALVLGVTDRSKLGLLLFNPGVVNSLELLLQAKNDLERLQPVLVIVQKRGRVLDLVQGRGLKRLSIGEEPVRVASELKRWGRLAEYVAGHCWILNAHLNEVAKTDYTLRVHPTLSLIKLSKEGI